MRIPGGGAGGRPIGRFGPRLGQVLSCLKFREFQVAEAIHCPSCSTRYRLRPERLRPSIRRAKCFSCGGVFPVADEVQRLLAPAQALAATASFDLETVAAAFELGPPAPSSLTLGDLADVDAEILEKTLVDVPAILPETKSEELPTPPASDASMMGGYASARDAIDKLFGDAPAQPTTLKTARNPSGMDMEATLTALEATLGGRADLPGTAGGDGPTASGRLPEIEVPSSATVRLSQEDLRAALAAGAPEAQVPSLQVPSPSAPPSAEASAPIEPAERFPMAAAADVPDAERLRLKVDEEIYAGLTLGQLTAWIEEGRILEHHLVARQHSENWLEAYKVPTLRPIFDRLRRERAGTPPALDTPPMEIAPKKSLFGGLFGKG